MNVLIDTNILLSAALRDRLPERVVIQIAQRDDWTWIVTPAILAEYVEVLRRPKFALGVQKGVQKGVRNRLMMKTLSETETVPDTFSRLLFSPLFSTHLFSTSPPTRPR
jgi:predicted nucleic acid-binding protein